MNNLYGPQWAYNVMPTVWPNGYPPSCTMSSATPMCWDDQAVKAYPFHNHHIDTLKDGNSVTQSSALAATVGGRGTAAGTIIDTYITERDRDEPGKKIPCDDFAGVAADQESCRAYCQTEFADPLTVFNCEQRCADCLGFDIVYGIPSGAFNPYGFSA